MSEEKKSEQVYTMEEVRQHKAAKSLWIVIHDEVYDISKFLEEVSHWVNWILKLQLNPSSRPISVGPT